MAYDDGRIACTDDALVIRRYYFPSGGKRIPYGAIASARRRKLTGIGISRGKVWGSNDFVHWYNYDPKRWRKPEALEIEVAGRWIKPMITPDNADSVAAELAAHGVAVTAV